MAKKLKGEGQPGDGKGGGAAGESEENADFAFVPKGKGVIIRSKETPSMDMLDVYVQNFRCAVIDYLEKDRKELTAAAA